MKWKIKMTDDHPAQKEFNKYINSQKTCLFLLKNLRNSI